jgi:hypothetical protein
MLIPGAGEALTRRIEGIEPRAVRHAGEAPARRIEGTEPRAVRHAPAEGPKRRPLNGAHYRVDDHGTVHRSRPKRDKTVSARQARIARKRLRRLEPGVHQS